MKTKKGDECSLWYQEEGQEPIFLEGKIKTLTPLVVTVDDTDYENIVDELGIRWIKVDG